MPLAGADAGLLVAAFGGGLVALLLGSLMLHVEAALQWLLRANQFWRPAWGLRPRVPRATRIRFSVDQGGAGRRSLPSDEEEQRPEASLAGPLHFLPSTSTASTRTASTRLRSSQPQLQLQLQRRGSGGGGGGGGGGLQLQLLPCVSEGVALGRMTSSSSGDDSAAATGAAGATGAGGGRLSSSVAGPPPGRGPDLAAGSLRIIPEGREAGRYAQPADVQGSAAAGAGAEPSGRPDDRKTATQAASSRPWAARQETSSPLPWRASTPAAAADRASGGGRAAISAPGGLVASPTVSARAAATGSIGFGGGRRIGAAPNPLVHLSLNVPPGTPAATAAGAVRRRGPGVGVRAAVDRPADRPSVMYVSPVRQVSVSIKLGTAPDAVYDELEASLMAATHRTLEVVGNGPGVGPGALRAAAGGGGPAAAAAATEHGSGGESRGVPGAPDVAAAGAASGPTRRARWRGYTAHLQCLPGCVELIMRVQYEHHEGLGEEEVAGGLRALQRELRRQVAAGSGGRSAGPTNADDSAGGLDVDYPVIWSPASGPDSAAAGAAFSAAEVGGRDSRATPGGPECLAAAASMASMAGRRTVRAIPVVMYMHPPVVVPAPPAAPPPRPAAGLPRYAATEEAEAAADPLASLAATPHCGVNASGDFTTFDYLPGGEPGRRRRRSSSSRASSPQTSLFDTMGLSAGSSRLGGSASGGVRSSVSEVTPSPFRSPPLMLSLQPHANQAAARGAAEAVSFRAPSLSTVLPECTVAPASPLATGGAPAGSGSERAAAAAAAVTAAARPGGALRGRRPQPLRALTCDERHFKGQCAVATDAAADGGDGGTDRRDPRRVRELQRRSSVHIIGDSASEFAQAGPAQQQYPQHPQQQQQQGETDAERAEALGQRLTTLEGTPDEDADADDDNAGGGRGASQLHGEGSEHGSVSPGASPFVAPIGVSEELVSAPAAAADGVRRGGRQAAAAWRAAGAAAAAAPAEMSADEVERMQRLQRHFERDRPQSLSSPPRPPSLRELSPHGAEAAAAGRQPTGGVVALPQHPQLRPPWQVGMRGGQIEPGGGQAQAQALAAMQAEMEAEMEARAAVQADMQADVEAQVQAQAQAHAQAGGGGVLAAGAGWVQLCILVDPSDEAAAAAAAGADDGSESGARGCGGGASGQRPLLPEPPSPPLASVPSVVDVRVVVKQHGSVLAEVERLTVGPRGASVSLDLSGLVEGGAALLVLPCRQEQYEGEEEQEEEGDDGGAAAPPAVAALMYTPIAVVPPEVASELSALMRGMEQTATEEAAATAADPRVIRARAFTHHFSVLMSDMVSLLLGCERLAQEAESALDKQQMYDGGEAAAEEEAAAAATMSALRELGVGLVSYLADMGLTATLRYMLQEVQAAGVQVRSGDVAGEEAIRQVLDTWLPDTDDPLYPAAPITNGGGGGGSSSSEDLSRFHSASSSNGLLAAEPAPAMPTRGPSGHRGGQPSPRGRGVKVPQPAKASRSQQEGAKLSGRVPHEAGDTSGHSCTGQGPAARAAGAAGPAPGAATAAPWGTVFWGFDPATESRFESYLYEQTSAVYGFVAAAAAAVTAVVDFGLLLSRSGVSDVRRALRARPSPMRFWRVGADSGGGGGKGGGGGGGLQRCASRGLPAALRRLGWTAGLPLTLPAALLGSTPYFRDNLVSGLRRREALTRICHVAVLSLLWVYGMCTADAPGAAPRLVLLMAALLVLVQPVSCNPEQPRFCLLPVHHPQGHAPSCPLPVLPPVLGTGRRPAVADGGTHNRQQSSGSRARRLLAAAAGCGGDWVAAGGVHGTGRGAGPEPATTVPVGGAAAGGSRHASGDWPRLMRL